MNKKSIIYIFIILNLFTYLLSQTKSGTEIISSNITLSYEFVNNGISINFSETEIESTAVTNTVLSIYGITTTTTLNLNNTNILAPASTVYYPYSLKNNGNESSTFNFDINDLLNAQNSDKINLTVVDNNNDTANIVTGKTLNAGEEISIYLKVNIPSDFTASSTIYSFQLSNRLKSNENYRAVDFISSDNDFIYGGASPFLDTINIQVDSDTQIAITKSAVILNNAGGNIETDELVPSSQITYTISYSNKISSSIKNIILTDSFDPSLVDYLISSTATSIGVISYSEDGVNFSEVEPSPTVGNVNENVQYIRLNLSSLDANQSGKLIYSVIVK